MLSKKKKSNTKDHTLYDFIYRKSTKQAKLWREKVVWLLCRAVRGQKEWAITANKQVICWEVMKVF